MNYHDDAKFTKLVDLVFNSEGEYSNDPDDPGGPTNHGIAWNYNKDTLLKRGITDVRSLTQDGAREIYYEDYWIPCGAGGIPDLRLAYIHFDCAVNSGVGASVQCLSKLSRNPKWFDAKAGKNDALWFRLFLEYLVWRLCRYNQDRNRRKYIEGWTNRLISLTVRALQMSN